MNNQLIQRVFCPECGAVRVCQGRSRYAVCPNGHGRLVARFTQAQRRKAVLARLPRARRISRSEFVIDGHEGRFVYQNGSGRRPAAPDETVQPDEVLARHVTRARTLIRVFTRKPPRRQHKNATRIPEP